MCCDAIWRNSEAQHAVVVAADCGMDDAAGVLTQPGGLQTGAARLGVPASVRRYLHHVDPHVAVDRAHQVADEDERSLQHAHENELVVPRIRSGDLGPEHLHARGDLRLVDEHLGDIVVRILARPHLASFRPYAAMRSLQRVDCCAVRRAPRRAARRRGGVFDPAAPMVATPARPYLIMSASRSWAPRSVRRTCG